MKIALDDKLQQYMKEHGHKDLVLYVKKGQGCCSGGVPMVQARFVKKEDGALEDKGYAAAETEMGKVYFEMDKIVLENNPELIYNRIFGKVVVQPIGMHVNDERFDRVCAIADMQR